MIQDDQERRNGDKFKWIATLIALIFLFIGVGASLSMTFRQTRNQDEESVPVDSDSGGVLVTEAGSSGGMRLKSVKLLSTQYEANGITEQADGAYIITATIEPSNADDQSVDWAITFIDIESEWASGKELSEYVTITPKTDGGLMATLECLKPFGEQIKVTVTSRENASITASCMVDYAKRIAGITMSETGSYLTTSPLDIMSATKIEGNFTAGACVDMLVFGISYTDYTVDDTFAFTLTSTLDETTFKEFLNTLSEDERSKFSVSTYTSTSTISNPPYLSIMTLFPQISYEGTMSGMWYTDTTATNLLTDWLKNNLTKTLLTWTFTCKGERSEWARTLPIGFTADGLTVHVTGVSLSEENIVI